MQSTVTNSAAETEKFARELAASLKPDDVLAFYGGLGMGKTTFVRGLAQGLGSLDEVSSPTFSLVHEYRSTPKLYHFDMYRVTSFDDLYSTGFFDYLETGAILAIEWSENIEDALPDRTIRVTFERWKRKSAESRWKEAAGFDLAGNGHLRSSGFGRIMGRRADHWRKLCKRQAYPQPDHPAHDAKPVKRLRKRYFPSG